MPPSTSANQDVSSAANPSLFPTLSFSSPLEASTGHPNSLLKSSPLKGSVRSPREREERQKEKGGTPAFGTPKGRMADPFDVRMRFTSQLQHLNASVTSAQKAANYALKYRDMDEDLHSCILEQLERNNMNNRANILYFIEHFIDSAMKENHLEFVRMMQRDILRVVDAVAPPDGSGAANVKVVRKVLSSLNAKNVLQTKTVAEIEECLKERETHPAHMALSPMAMDMNGIVDDGKSRGKANGVGAAGIRLDKRQIEQRIEEDRERNKRLREGVWAVKGDEDFEVGKVWEEGSDVGEDEDVLGEDEVEERLGMHE